MLHSRTVSSIVIRIRYSCKAAASSLESIRVAYTSTYGTSLYKAVKLSNLKRTGCGSKRLAFEVSNVRLSVNAYPNPTGDEFSISVSDADEVLPVEYFVFDNNGRLVESGNFLSDATLKLGREYATGLYHFVAIRSNDRN